MAGEHRPELVICVIGALGTDMDCVCGAIAKALARVKYSSEIIDLGAVLSEVTGLGTPAGEGAEYSHGNK